MKSAFDNHAEDYDAVFTNSPIGIAQRERVWLYLKQYLPKSGASILETNAGTGVDALHLTKQGYALTITDASAQMLEVAAARFKATNTPPAAIFQWDLHKPFPKKDIKYDAVFSNFGGWNCLEKQDVINFSKELHQQLSPKSKVIAVVMGTNCLWEQFYFLLKGNKKAATRRQTGAMVSAAITEHAAIDTRYFSPEELAACFNGFTVITKKPIGLFIPPSYLNPFFKNKQWLLQILKGLEKIFSFPIWSNYADHYLIVFEKTEIDV